MASKQQAIRWFTSGSLETITNLPLSFPRSSVGMQSAALLRRMTAELLLNRGYPLERGNQEQKGYSNFGHL